jgi:hypothetical protein
MYLPVLEKIDGMAGWVMHPFAYRLIMFIAGRTLKYNKWSEHIPMNHFLNGVWSGNSIVAGGVNMDRASVYRYLNWLEAGHFIIRRSINKRPLYAIDLEGLTQIEQDAMQSHGVRNMGGHVNISKKRKAQSHTATKVSHTATVQSHGAINLSRKATPINREENRELEIEKEMPEATPRAKVLRSISIASNKTQEARQRQKEKFNTASILKHWQDTWSSSYPAEPVGIPQGYQVVALRKALRDRIANVEHRVPLLIWSVQNFRDVIKAKWKWKLAGGGLDLPNMGFLCTNIDDFYRSYLDTVNPNRKLDRRIREADSEPDNADKLRIAELEKQVSILKQQTSTAGAVQSNDDGDKEARALARRKAIRKIALGPRKKTGEFGEWGDKG